MFQRQLLLAHGQQRMHQVTLQPAVMMLRQHATNDEHTAQDWCTTFTDAQPEACCSQKAHFQIVALDWHTNSITRFSATRLSILEYQNKPAWRDRTWGTHTLAHVLECVTFITIIYSATTEVWSMLLMEAHLEQTAAQAKWFIGNTAAVEVSPKHADDRATLLVADGIEEGLNPASRVHTCIPCATWMKQNQSR